MQYARILLTVCIATAGVALMQSVSAGDNKIAADQQDQPPTLIGQPAQDLPKKCDSSDDSHHNVDYATLLNPDADVQKRQPIFADLVNKANAGDVDAQYYVGSLYRAGHILPKPLVDRDLNKARVYLGHAAIGGKPEAMRKLAEIELVEKHPVEAMVWAQLYAHYEDLATNASPKMAGKGQSADLLARAFDAFGSRDIDAVKSDVADFIQQHDATMLAAKHEDEKSVACENFALISPGDIRMPDEGAVKTILFGNAKPGTAEFLLVFGPDGAVTKALALDAVPDPGLLRTMRPLAEGMRVHPSALPVRYGLLPLQFTYGEAQIHK